jgi:hypothetical protein
MRKPLPRRCQCCKRRVASVRWDQGTRRDLCNLCWTIMRPTFGPLQPLDDRIGDPPRR